MTLNVWVIAGALAVMLSTGGPAGVAGRARENPQLQGPNLRIEFDRNLQSRVIARFNNKETAMGPYTASESVMSADHVWSELALTVSKHEHVSDSFGAGEQLIVTGKSEALIKTVTVTMNDEFPAMAFFDVQYTNAGKVKLIL